MIKYAKKKEKEKEAIMSGNSEDASHNIEFVLHEGLKDTIQKEVVNKQKEKEKLENESWWETAERKRKEKKKQQRKERLKKIMSSDQDGVEDEQEIDEDDLLGEQKLAVREKEKQKQKKEEEEKRKQNLELLMSDYNAEKGFDIKRDTDREITRRRKNQESKKKNEENENEAPLIIGDDRFTDVFLDPEFHLDQTHPKYKKTNLTSKIMEKRREESLKRQEKEESLYSSKLKKRKL